MESFNRSGKFCIRFADAKFALPKVEDDPASDFLCLDMPEYPIEHDDILIVFDNEAGMLPSSPVTAVDANKADRTNFQNAAPGSVKEPSRMGSLRR